MKTISQVMTRDPRALAPSDSVRRAAQLMEELGVGALPVCEGERLVGIVTDRDIAVRGVAQGLAGPDAILSEIMTREIKWCLENAPIDDVLDTMSTYQIRRMPVVDRQHHLVGIVSLGDLATKVGDGHVARSLSEISESQEEHRAGMLPVAGKGKAKSGDGAAASRRGA
jgi:CBS domain-containing protein